MAEAIKTTAGEDESAVTTEISYLEPGKPGTLTSTARIRKGGGRITITEAEITQEKSGEVVALATGTYTRIG